MTTRSSPSAASGAFPLKKSDIQYDAASEEVSLQREKFDALVKYVQVLQERLEAAEDARDVAQYRARKESKTADVLEALQEDVVTGTTAVRDWLASGHTLQELSERTAIPYATCHRIVKERLGSPNLEVGHLQRMVSAVARSRRRVRPAAKSHPRFKRVLLGLSKGSAAHDLVSSWEAKGSEVSTVHGGREIAAKVKELHPNLILLDVSLPNLEKSGWERLKDFVKEKKGTIVLTGEIGLANSALLQTLVEEKTKTQEAATEGETAGG